MSTKELFEKALQAQGRIYGEWPDRLQISLSVMNYIIELFRLYGSLTLTETLELQDLIETLKNEYMGGAHDGE